MCVQLWRTASFLRSLVAHDHHVHRPARRTLLYLPFPLSFVFFFALSPVLFSVGEYYVCILFFIIIAFCLICMYKYPFFSFFSFSFFPLFLAVSFTTYSHSADTHRRVYLRDVKQINDSSVSCTCTHTQFARNGCMCVQESAVVSLSSFSSSFSACILYLGVPHLCFAILFFLRFTIALSYHKWYNCMLRQI